MAFGTPTLERLPLYLRVLKTWAREGKSYASGAVLAHVLAIDPIVVRKDLARTGVRGTPRKGFPIDQLIHSIEKLTGADTEMIAILVGVGKLGSALLSYPGFKKQGLHIAAAFDAAPERCNIIMANTPILPVSLMIDTIHRMGVTLGILSVPSERAQQVADQMVAAGIRAIWNFTPTQLEVPNDVLVQREDLAVSLAVLLHRVRERENKCL